MDVIADWGYWGLFIGSFLASTVLPFSSDALFIGMIIAGADIKLSIISATIGNWLGGLTTYYVGYLGRWEWIENILRVSREKLEAQSNAIKKYGALIALMSWVPVIGDVVSVALGFYKVDFKTTAIYMLIGRTLRFVIWALLYFYANRLFN